MHERLRRERDLFLALLELDRFLARSSVREQGIGELFGALPGSHSTAHRQMPGRIAAVREYQKELLLRALTKHDWNVSETARSLDLARSTMNSLIRQHGLRREHD